MGTETGISFISISLIELDFKLNKKFKLPKDGIPVDIGVKTKTSYSPDKKTLVATLSAVLFAKTKNPPFVMKVSVEGTFTGDNFDELRKFSKVHAPAHLMPFIREIVGTTTMKAGIPPLLLPPINLAALFEKKKK
ncbi:MAG: protein-export chaperone SecB [Nitrospirae bacterium]|nr:protein-export chaperone SecB [Nitrospirota bacterium]